MKIIDKIRGVFKPEAFLQSVKVTAVVAFLFSVTVGVLLSINYLRLKSSDPIEREIVDSLVLRLQETPNDEGLKDQIRQLDLLARKAYFSSQWQLETGAYLLIGGTIVFALCVFIINSISRKPNLPDAATKRNASDHWKTQFQRRRFIFVTCCFCALFVGYLGIQFPKLEKSSELSGEQTAIAGEESKPIEDLDPSLVWPGFRGMGGNSIASVNTAPVDWDFDSGRGIKWSVRIPKSGMNSPVVWGNQIFLSGADETSQEIYCYNLNDGSLVWNHQLRPNSSASLHAETGGAAPSMAVDGRYVCAVFADGNLVCTNLDGEENWSVSLGVPENHYGHSSSLIIYNDFVFVQWDQSVNPRLLAYNLKDGSLAWQVERYALSWSSPICVNTGEGFELILTDSESITSYNPDNGTINWRKEDISGGEMGPSAFYRNGVVYAGTDMAQLIAIELRFNEEPNILWSFDEHLPDTASVVGTDDYLFIATSYGVLACVDVKEGKLIWEQEAHDGFYSSPILVGDTVYAWDMEGTAYIFSADGKFNKIAEIPTPESVVSTPAFVGSNIIFRGEQHLYCIESNLTEGEESR
jgi:outer membrane protein assembly factor BamB